MIGYLTQMLYGWFGPYDPEYKVFIGYRILSPWRLVFWGTFAGAYVLPQLFWIKKVRTFIPYILLVVLAMHTDDLVEFFSKDYRDYYDRFYMFGAPVHQWTEYLPILIFPAILTAFIFKNKMKNADA